MTKDQIDVCLQEVSESANAWTTLEGKFTHISVQCDNNLFIDPKSCQYYFDDTTELLFIRHTYEKPQKIENGAAIPDGYVSISHNGVPYIIKLEEGGADDVTIGRFHEAISYELIVGLFRLPPPEWAK